MFKKVSIVLLIIAMISSTTYARTIRLDSISPYSATSPVKDISLKDMEKAILLACIQLKWKKCEVIELAHIEAVLHVRTHKLIVDITYSDKDYTIKYKDSTNLKYNGKKIHSAYQKWYEISDEKMRYNLKVYPKIYPENFVKVKTTRQKDSRYLTKKLQAILKIT